MHIKTVPYALAAALLAPVSLSAVAAPPPGAYRGGVYVRPVQPIYRPGGPGVRPIYPGWRVGYPGYRPGFRPGWNAAYWGPRGGWYYGGPGYWGPWPYAAALGFGLGGYAAGVPYASVPLVINTVTTPQVYIEQAAPPAAPPLPVAVPAASYWYYCTQPAGYFPYVKDCSQPWLKVVPQVPGEQATPPQLFR